MSDIFSLGKQQKEIFFSFRVYLFEIKHKELNFWNFVKQSTNVTEFFQSLELQVRVYIKRSGHLKN